ncbi:MAG: hypothetical protein EBZ32_13255 [Rhodobacteraceae bacterium]|nr:hypothetical protein [Paracoccaceae bacterium]
MTQKFNNLIDLVKIVSEMERDLGLSDISNSERKVLLAISDLENREGVAKTKAILSHELTVGISPTYFTHRLGRQCDKIIVMSPYISNKGF